MSAREVVAEVDGEEIVIRIKMPARSTPALASSGGDRLIRLEKSACDEAGFELKGLKAKVDAGLVPTVKIGRASYVRMSDLCKLAELTAREQVAEEPASDDDDSYARLVASPRRRRRANAS